MNRHETPQPGATPIAWHQRWRVAQRLAQGDTPEQAAGWADVPVETVESLHAEARFHVQIKAEEELLALSDEAWAERLKGQVRQAVERALAEGKVSTVNLLLRTSLVLPAVAKGGAAGRAALAAALVEADAASEAARVDLRAAAPISPEAAILPAVEADPMREARRQAILAGVKPVLRPGLGGAGLELLESYAAAVDPDPTAYEAWFAAQPKPAFATVALPAEDQAAIRHVTRHNPPWLRGDFLGYYRPPVPREAFKQDATGTVATRAAPPMPEPAPRTVAPAAPADPLAGLGTRLARLLDRDAPRLPEELDLAEAVCAVRWPNWPRYAGSVDLGLLRQALKVVRLDDDTLHWLGSHELAQACSEASPRAPPTAG